MVRITLTIAQITVVVEDPKEVEAKHHQEDVAVLLREALVLPEEVKALSQLLVVVVEQEVEERKPLLLHGQMMVIMKGDTMVSLEMERIMVITELSSPEYWILGKKEKKTHMRTRGGSTAVDMI
jgi:hypothetical protein